jgi:site-specific recombinase XerD
VEFRNYIYFRLALDTGLRLNELINVKIKNIDLEKNMIEVTVTKTDRDRFVIFSHKTKTLLTTFFLAHPHKSEYLFINYKNGEQLAKSSIHSMTLAIKKKLGIKEDFNPHSWRHTFATSFIRNKGNIVILKELLGHSNVRTTQKYLHFDKQDLLDGYVTVFED